MLEATPAPPLDSTTSKPRSPEEPLTPWSTPWVRHLAVLAMVIFVGFILREWRLGSPPSRFFDETYYVKAGLEYLEGKPDSNTVHPPLGKICIAAGIWCYQKVAPTLVGLHLIDQVSDPVGWRLGSLVAGVLMIPLTYVLGRRMFRNRLVGLMAAFLLAFDPLHLTQSRIAMLDMFVAFFILAGAWASWRFIDDDEGHETRWAVASVVLFSLGAACKWNSLFAAAGAVPAMVLLRRYAPGMRLRWALRIVALYAALLPAIYLASFGPFFAHGGTFKQMRDNHVLMYTFRKSKDFTHRYMSEWWQWPLMSRPVWYHYDDSTTPEDCIFPNRNDTPLTRLIWHGDDPGLYVVGVLAIGSPFAWITFLIFYALTLVQSIALPLSNAVMAGLSPPPAGTQEGSGADDAAAGSLAAATPAPRGPVGRFVDSLLEACSGPERPWIYLVLLYTPQVLLWSLNKGFLFYMLPCTPFMAIMAAAVLQEWEELPMGDLCIVLYLGIAGLCTLAYYPLLAAYPLPKPLYHILIPFSKWI